MSLYISHVDASVTHSQLAGFFLWYGELKSIEIVQEDTRNVVYIKYVNMYDNHKNQALQQELTENNQARIYYTDHQYWIVTNK